MVYDKQRHRHRKRCLECNRKGSPGERLNSSAKAVQYAFWGKVATLDELMFIGAPKDEIPTRSGWKHEKSMRTSLQRKNLLELLERYRAYS